jgi:Ca2+ transporting ATPase
VGDGKLKIIKIAESFEDEMLRVLCLAAVVSLGLGIATVTSGNNWVKEQQFKKLNAIASRKAVNVVRSGHVENISVDDLLVGDIQIIETG